MSETSGGGRGVVHACCWLCVLTGGRHHAQRSRQKSEEAVGTDAFAAVGLFSTLYLLNLPCSGALLSASSHSSSEATEKDLPLSMERHYEVLGLRPGGDAMMLVSAAPPIPSQ